MNKSIEKHYRKMLEVDNQLKRNDLSWKRRKDLTKHKHRLWKELQDYKRYTNVG